MTIALVITTVSTLEEARALARALVEERLAACVQLTAIESVYRWEGLQQEPEVRLDCKTPHASAGRLQERIEALHPYDTPEVLVLSAEASAGYQAWAVEQAGGG
ncbi:MAG: divalent-cation tolerance protein CutA [Parvularculaceae bacterium]|nr:divalent-cation tolerance protein CutA [Parvularculaceae bacterium]